MKKSKKITISIIALILSLVLAISVYLIASNWQSIKARLNGEVLFTKDQVEDLVDNAYNEGVGQGDAFKIIIDQLTQSLSDVTLERDVFIAKCSGFEIQLKNKDDEILILVETKENLEEIKAQLEGQVNQNVELINSLNGNINALNLKISGLENDRLTLATKIAELETEVQNKNNSIEYYKQLLEAYESSNKVIATFQLDDGTIHFVQVLTPGETPTVDSSTIEDFLYWSVDGVQVDPATTPITENTIFVAVTTQKHTVKFDYAGEIIKNYKVNSGTYASAEVPADTVYKRFNYWMLNGVEVNTETYPITTNVIFVANITYSYDVNFTNNGVNFDQSQIIENGKFASMPATNPVKDGYKFIGYSLDGTKLVNLATTPITANTTFIAMFERKLVVNFISDGQPFGQSQSIESGACASNPTGVPFKDGYIFKGYSLDGINVVDLTKTPITEDTTFIAVFEQKVIVKFMNGSTTFATQELVKNSKLNALENPISANKLFIGWSTTNSADNIINFNSFVATQNITLYAVFRDYQNLNINEIKINVGETFWGNEGSVNVAQLKDIKILKIEFDIEFAFTNQNYYEGPAHLIFNNGYCYVDMNASQGLLLDFQTNGNIEWFLDGENVDGGEFVEFTSITLKNIKISY